ncbi:protein kinase [Nocardia sp. NPDC057353]|uniref:protein kinase domain-containing protein n=1 Tax=Nocardia sp. NPDC057353 TaxID=3346104 RepID=UPI003645B33A
MAHGTRTGTRFGPYELRSVLGRGGMGEVYEAFDTVKNRTVAVKLLTEELARDPVYQVRFRRESQAAARLADPHVVPIHDWGVIDGTLFLDMRLIAGIDLRAVLAADGAMAPERAVGIVEQVAAALDAAHAAGLVHRDVKPSDILLTATDFAYLTDFGIADTEGDAAVTVVGVGPDSYAYTAPERFDAGPVTAAADIYALTCVLYECLTGAPPYPADTLNVLLRAHLTEPPPRPSLRRAGVPAGLDEVVARGLAKQPGERYASALELARAARAAVGGAAGSVRPTVGAAHSWFDPGAAGPAQSEPVAPSGAGGGSARPEPAALSGVGGGSARPEPAAASEEFAAFGAPESAVSRGIGAGNPFAASAAGTAGLGAAASPARAPSAGAAAPPPGAAAAAGSAAFAAQPPGVGAAPGSGAAPPGGNGAPGAPDEAVQTPAAFRGTGTGPEQAPPSHSSTGGHPITPPGPYPNPGGPGRPPTGGHPIPSRRPAETTPPDSNAGPAEAGPVVPAGTPVPNPATGATLVVRVPEHLLPESERRPDATGEHKVVKPSGATEVRLGEVQFSLPPDPEPEPEPAPGSGQMRAFPDAHLYAGGQQYLPPEHYQPPDATANETTQYIPPVRDAAPETTRYGAPEQHRQPGAAPTPAAETTRYIPEQAYSAVEPAVDPGYDRDNPRTEYLGPAGYAEPGYDDRYDRGYGEQGYPDQGYDRDHGDDPYGAYDPYGPQDPDGYADDGYYDEEPKPRSRARAALGPVLATVVVLLALAVVGTIGWQRFAGGDSSAPSAAGPNATAVAPTAGLTGAAAPTGPATTTRPDPTTTTAPRSSTTTGSSSTTSASRTSTTSATTSAGAVSLPAGASPCDQGSASTPYSRTATGSGATSCGFAEAVQEAYSASGGASQSVEAVSPVTGRSYTMTCTPNGTVVTCTGGDNAVVYVY